VGGYAFGDGPTAARRLDLLADLFEPASRTFLERVAGLDGLAGRRPGLAVDLGCGTGHTTRLVAEVLRPARPPVAVAEAVYRSLIRGVMTATAHGDKPAIPKRDVAHV